MQKAFVGIHKIYAEGLIKATYCTSIHRCRLVHLYICNLLHITEILIFSHRCGLNLKINLIYHKD